MLGIKVKTALFLTVVVCNINRAAGDTCSNNKDKIACGTADGCVWCRSRAVPSACLQTIHATSLPTSVFFCDFTNVSKLHLMRSFITLNVYP